MIIDNASSKRLQLLHELPPGTWFQTLQGDVGMTLLQTNDQATDTLYFLAGGNRGWHVTAIHRQYIFHGLALDGARLHMAGPFAPSRGSDQFNPGALSMSESGPVLSLIDERGGLQPSYYWLAQGGASLSGAKWSELTRWNSSGWSLLMPGATGHPDREIYRFPAQAQANL